MSGELTTTTSLTNYLASFALYTSLKLLKDDCFSYKVLNGCDGDIDDLICSQTPGIIVIDWKEVNNENEDPF